MKIPLTKGLFAEVDDDMFDYLNQWKWYAQKTKKTFYANRRTWPEEKTISMHGLIIGSKKGQNVDHADGNGLNNTKGNLRICTKSQNAMNAGHKGNKFGFKGVAKNKKKFMAHIMVNRKYIHGGTHTAVEDAARAYDKLAIKYFGEFAQLNFP